MTGKEAFENNFGKKVAVKIRNFGKVIGKICGYDSHDGTLLIRAISLEAGTSLRFKDLTKTTKVAEGYHRAKKGYMYINQSQVV